MHAFLVGWPQRFSGIKSMTAELVVQALARQTAAERIDFNAIALKLQLDIEC